MFPFFSHMFPGTNLQDLNLDWIIRRVMELSKGIIAPWINSQNQHWMVYDTAEETFVDSGVSAAGESDKQVDGLTKYILNKRIAVFGDSISDESLNPNVFPDIYNVWVNHFRELVEPYGATVINYAFHGAGYVQAVDGENIATRVLGADLSEIDTVILFAGINDYFHNVKFGKAMDNSNANNTLWKSLKQIGDKLRGKSVFVVTPLPTSSYDSLNIMTTTEMYRVALKTWCNGYGFSLINGTTIPGFYKNSPNYADNIHPKNDSSYIIADYIFQKIVQGGEAFSPYLEAVRKDFASSDYYSSGYLQVYMDGDSVNYVFSFSNLSGIPQGSALEYQTITLNHYFMQTAAFTNGNSFGFVVSSMNDANQRAGGIGGSIYTGTIATPGYSVFQISGLSPCLTNLTQVIQ